MTYFYEGWQTHLLIAVLFWVAMSVLIFCLVWVYYWWKDRR